MSERKIVYYFIAYSDRASGLQVIVNDKIKEGFQPFGSLIFEINNEMDYAYRQAMVKYE